MGDLIILDSERRNFPSSNKLLSNLYNYLEDVYLRIIYNFFILPQLEKYIHRKDTKIITIDKETEIFLTKKNIPFSTINQYVKESDVELYRKKAMDLVRNLPNSFPAIDVNYLGISLWTTDELDIYESFFKPIIINIEVIKKIINKEKPSRLIIFNSSSRLGMIQEMFRSHIQIEGKTDVISAVKKKIFRLLMPFAVKTVYSDFFKKIKHSKYKPFKSNHVIFFESERGFRSSEPFLEKIKNKLTILQDQKYIKKGVYPYDLLENYLNRESKQRLLQFKKTLDWSLSKLKKSSLRYDLKYNGLNLYGVLEDMFEYLFNTSYLRGAYYCECLNNFFQYSKPKLMITMCAMPQIHQIAFNISKKHKSRSLLVIHGSLGITPSLSNFLISDKVAVYGRFYKELLLKFGDIGKKIVVTGNPAWDYLTKKDFNKKKLISRLKLPRNKKIILLATTPFPLDFRDKLAYSVIKAMLELPEYHLIIKIHPEEKPDFYYKLLKKYRVEARIIEDLDLLHPLISISELVIISNSTVGLETLMLDKPLIDVNLTKNPYDLDYVDKKVVLGVRKEEDLLPAIKSILDNKDIRERLKKNRKKYIYEHSYKRDGKASERVANLINKMVNERKKESLRKLN